MSTNSARQRAVRITSKEGLASPPVSAGEACLGNNGKDSRRIHLKELEPKGNTVSVGEVRRQI